VAPVPSCVDKAKLYSIRFPQSRTLANAETSLDHGFVEAIAADRVILSPTAERSSCSNNKKLGTSFVASKGMLADEARPGYSQSISIPLSLYFEMRDWADLIKVLREDLEETMAENSLLPVP